jgi:hypothetical protein
MGDQQQPGLQLHQRDADRVDRWRHRVCDDPPQVWRHQLGLFVLGVLQKRSVLWYVEVEEAI